MKDYSQNGEGAIIAEYFGSFVGTLLDIGANDGITLSNSRGLMEAGWNGVLVEPAEVAFAKLMENSLYLGNGPTEFFRDDNGHPVMNVFRGHIKCINAAITTTDGPIDFWDCGVHLHKGDTSLLSTTRPETLERWKRSGEQFTKTTVRGITFATLLEELGLEIQWSDSTMSVPHPAHFDFISIDAEGADYSILAQIPLRDVGCRLLCVETNGKDDQKFIDYCARHGMKLVRRVVENLIFSV